MVEMSGKILAFDSDEHPHALYVRVYVREDDAFQKVQTLEFTSLKQLGEWALQAQQETSKDE